MGATEPIVISAIGMPSSVGHTAAQTFASISAKITRRSELPELYFCYPENKDFDEPTPLVAAAISYLEEFRATKPNPAEWLAHIAANAFLDLAAGMALTQKNLNDGGFFFSLSPQHPGWDQIKKMNSSIIFRILQDGISRTMYGPFIPATLAQFHLPRQPHGPYPKEK